MDVKKVVLDVIEEIKMRTLNSEPQTKEEYIERIYIIANCDNLSEIIRKAYL